MNQNNVEKLKKALIYTTIGIVFLSIMWLIFSPKENKEKNVNAIDSISSIPDPTTSDFFDDKMAVYDKLKNKSENDSSELRDQQILDSIFASNEQMSNIPNDSMVSTDEPQTITSKEAISQVNDIIENTSKYREEEERMERLQEHNIELERRLRNLEYQKEESKAALRSYSSSLSSASNNYDNTNNDEYAGAGVSPVELAKMRATDREIAPSFTKAKKKVIKIELDKKDNVSVLGGGDDIGVNSFNSDLTSKKKDDNEDSKQNTIKAVIDHTITIRDGDIVPLRLMQSVRIDDVYYPKNTIVYGLANIGNTRLNINISKLKINNSIYNTDLVVYDNDGQQGLYVPILSKNSLSKEISKGIGSSTGSSASSINISGNNDPVRQLQSDATRGVISGISNFIQNKLTEVKITLKGGYNVYIMSNQN